MLMERILPQPEVIRAIVSEDSPWCGGAHRAAVGPGVRVVIHKVRVAHHPKPPAAAGQTWSGIAA